MSVMNKINNKKKYSIVVAHPDEILWYLQLYKMQKNNYLFYKTNNSKIITAGEKVLY